MGHNCFKLNCFYKDLNQIVLKVSSYEYQLLILKKGVFCVLNSDTMLSIKEYIRVSDRYVCMKFRHDLCEWTASDVPGMDSQSKLAISRNQKGEIIRKTGGLTGK